MVAIVLTFPSLVLHYKGTATKVDPMTIQIGVDDYGSDGYGDDPFGSDSMSSYNRGNNHDSDPFMSDSADDDPYAVDSFDIQKKQNENNDNSLEKDHQRSDSQNSFDVEFQ